MFFEPFLVVGTGRSGTSTVARLLHEKLGIYMGDKFKSPSPQNPDGTFEDTEFTIPNSHFINGKMDFQAWDGYTRHLIERRYNEQRPWGIKDPGMSHIFGLYLNYFKEPKIIRCRRDGELVIRSMMRCYGWNRELAEGIYRTREVELDRILKGRDHLTIDFGEGRIDDDTVETIIRRKFFEHPKVYLAILNHGWLRREMAWSKIGTMQKTPGVDVTWENPNKTWGEPICSNRAEIVQRFLKTDCDYLMMIDDDIIPLGNPMEFAHAGKDIVGFPAKVRQKGRAMNWVAYYEINDVGYMPCDFGLLGDRLADLAPVDVVGTGCILIARRVLEKVKKPFLVEFDKYGINRFGTDFAFCRRAKKAGFEIYTAPNCICEHVKEIGLLDSQQFDDSDYRDNSVSRYQLPFGEWSINQKDWHFIKDIIDEKKPDKILEFGTGLSSLLMSEYAAVVSYETDEKHMENIVGRKQRDNKLKVRMWDGMKLKGRLGRYDMAFVDGPTGRPSGGVGRRESIRLASEHADAVIVHDARREDEWKWQMEFLKPDFKLTKVSGYYQICCHLWERKNGSDT